MGCWAETCGLSGLPIEMGDEAALFVLVPGHHHNDSRSGFSYPVGEWFPWCPAFYGTYDECRGSLRFNPVETQRERMRNG